MGNRISISFRNVNNSFQTESVALFHHWGGEEFAEEAQEFVDSLPPYEESNPISRREPNSIMVAFIQEHLKAQPMIDGSYYLGANGSDGDNSDNGHRIIDLT